MKGCVIGLCGRHLVERIHKTIQVDSDPEPGTRPEAKQSDRKKYMQAKTTVTEKKTCPSW